MKLALLAAMLAAACSTRPEPDQPLPPLLAVPADAGAALPPAGPLPEGVLAQAQGIQGLIQVIERDGMRQLVIGGVVHAAVPADGRGGADPAVALTRALRPKGKTALVIGLGSGKTAGDLMAAGYEVEAVELEPAVIEYARKYFGYRGRAVAMEGGAFLVANQRIWDLVLMDASGGDPNRPPETLTSAEALVLLMDRVAAGGLLVLRLVGEPRAPLVTQLQSQLRGRRGFVQQFGSGVGGEQQNLYLVRGDQGINFVNAAGIAVWPHDRQQSPLWADPEQLAGDPTPTSRRVRLVGYVVRLRENGALVLDLPHWEMGAMRYLLSGPLAAELGKRIPGNARFPTSGDIASDGDTQGTLHEVLGGGGVKRSDVRFSPVVALIEGTATLRSVVHPDAAAAVPARLRGDTPTDPLLPYGGALYDLTVDTIVWSSDAAGWAAVRGALAPIAKQAITAIDRGQPRVAREQLLRYQAALRQRAVPDHLPPTLEIADLLAAIAVADKLLPAAGPLPPLVKAMFCDHALHGRDIEPAEKLDPDILAIDRALLRCAIAGYQVVARDRKHPRRVGAAGRAYVLWDLTVDWDDPRTEKMAAAEKGRLKQNVPALEEVDQPLAPE